MITLSVIWGDETITPDADDEASGDDNEPLQRVFPASPGSPAAAVYPITVQLADDDTGLGKYLFEHVTIPWNDDDDDENGIPDYLDAFGGSMEDDLVVIDFRSFLQNIPSEYGDGALRIESHSNYDSHYSLNSCYDSSTDCPPIPVTRFWLDAEKTQPLFIAYDGTELPSDVTSIWVEGTQVGDATLFVSWRALNPYNMLGAIDILLGQVLMQVKGAMPWTLDVREQYIDEPSWYPTDDDILWMHNQHRWTLMLGHGRNHTEISDFRVYAHDRPRNDKPEGGSSLAEFEAWFAQNEGVQLINTSPNAKNNEVFAQPLQKEVFYTAIYRATVNPGKFFSNTNLMNFIGIQASIEWNGAGNPNYGSADDYDVIYPEQRYAGELSTANPAYTVIKTRVNFNPPIPSTRDDMLYIEIFDPDNRIDDARDINGNKANDNLLPANDVKSPTIDASTGGGLIPFRLADRFKPLEPQFEGEKVISIPVHARHSRGDRFETDYVDAFFRVNSPQPGNNWVLAFHNDKRVLNRISFDSKDLVFKPSNRPAHNVKKENQTAELVAKRTLWLELDEMPQPTQFDFFLKDMDDAETFETVNGDKLVEFLEVYLKDTFIVPRIAVHNPRQFIEFKQYSAAMNGPLFKQPWLKPDATPYIVEASRNTRDNPSTQFFWSIQVVSAYESAIDSDGDLDARAPQDVSFAQWYSSARNDNSKGVLGYSFSRDGLGPSVVFSEEIRDIQDENPADMVDDPIIIVAAHEAMHRFFGWHDEGPQALGGLMDGKKSLASEDFLGYKFDITPTPLQFRFLQSRLRPL